VILQQNGKTLEQARFFYVKNVAAVWGRLPHSPMWGDFHFLFRRIIFENIVGEYQDNLMTIAW
jgi:hypothetical protein